MWWLKKTNLFGNGIMIGYVNKQNTTDERFYYVKDHLGSVRLTLNGNNIESGKDYFAYGSISRNVNYGEAERYNFTEKERDAETRLNYFGARYYDSDTSRWLSADPLADKYPGLSPYNYVTNNPLILIDPNGMEMTNYEVDSDGYINKRDDKGDSDPYDILFTKDGNKSVIINDKSILSGLSEKSLHYRPFQKQGHFARSKDQESAFTAFKFLAENTNVEWSLRSNNKLGNNYFTLLTSNYSGSVKGLPTDSFTRSTKLSLNYIIHSHPNGSEFGTSDTDRDSYEFNNSLYGYKFNFNIYDVSTHQRIQYNMKKDVKISPVNSIWDLYE